MYPTSNKDRDHYLPYYYQSHPHPGPPRPAAAASPVHPTRTAAAVSESSPLFHRRGMTIWKRDADAPADAEKGAAGEEPAAEKPFFVSPFREPVLYAWYMVQIVGLSIVIVALLILECNK